MNAIEGLANKQFLEPLLAATYIWGEKYIYIYVACAMDMYSGIQTFRVQIVYYPCTYVIHDFIFCKDGFTAPGRVNYSMSVWCLRLISNAVITC